jgi:hypothetical protein
LLIGYKFVDKNGGGFPVISLAPGFSQVTTVPSIQKPFKTVSDAPNHTITWLKPGANEKANAKQ